MKIPDSFLLDEVRCGFVIPAAVKQAWAAELEVLGEIDRVCKKHNIQYFADWGTLLGTVRHGGFIPWDDDLDIVMKRADYQKFLEVASHDMAEGFHVRTYRNHDDWLFMGKVVGRDGFSFEKEHLRRFHNFQYIACIDIFVLDYVYRDPMKEERRRNLCKYILTVADTIGQEQLSPAEYEPRLKVVEDKFNVHFQRKQDPTEMRRYLYGEVEKIFAEVPEEEADKITQMFPRGLKDDAFHFPKEYYEEALYLPFENTQIAVPKLYDKMLKSRYGTYMYFVKNRAGHDYPFFESQKRNLQKVLDFELPEFRVDKSKILRGEEELSAKNLSYKAMARECISELVRLRIQLTEELADVEKAVQSLQDSQQIAIDLGNMLEVFCGEDCSVIGLLEQYCEAIYALYEMLTASARQEEIAAAREVLAKKCREIEEELSSSVLSRSTVLFLPVMAKDWSYLQPLWEEAVKEEKCDVMVVPLPYFFKDYDGSPREICYEGGKFPEGLPVLDYKELTAEYLEMLHPEKIIIQNPYDNWNAAISVPDMFYSLQLRKCTDELIYVAPFAADAFTRQNEREYGNMKYYVTMPGVVYADRILVQSEAMRQVYVERLSEFAGEETKAVWEERIQPAEPAFQDKPNKRTSGKKKVLYGISVGTYLGEQDMAKKKLESNLQLFEAYKEGIDYSVFIYPDAHAVEILGEIELLMKDAFCNIVREEVKEYLEEFDSYYGDSMPLVTRFREQGKPVMIQSYICVGE